MSPIWYKHGKKMDRQPCKEQKWMVALNFTTKPKVASSYA